MHHISKCVYICVQFNNKNVGFTNKAFLFLFICFAESINWDGRPYILASPNFPSLYSNNIFLTWNIKAPRFFLGRANIITFDLQQNSDFVYIGQGVDDFSDDFEEWTRLTGSLRDIWEESEFIFNSSFISVIFTSDGDTRYSGFRIEFSGVKIGEPTTEIQKVHTTQPCIFKITTTTLAEISTGT